jgi:hypothetical protein
MEKEFVPYQEALAIKELGFDEPCIATYQHPSKYSSNLVRVDADSEGSRNSNLIRFTSAPLYQQVFRWFREKCLLEGIIEQADDFYWYKFSVYFYNIEGKQKISNGLEFETYEEAEVACLNKLIEIAKTNKKK